REFRIRRQRNADAEDPVLQDETVRRGIVPAGIRAVGAVHGREERILTVSAAESAAGCRRAQAESLFRNVTRTAAAPVRPQRLKEGTAAIDAAGGAQGLEYTRGIGKRPKFRGRLATGAWTRP